MVREGERMSLLLGVIVVCLIFYTLLMLEDRLNERDR